MEMSINALPDARRRNHAALVLVVHGEACPCDLCRASVAVLRAFDPSASVCSICGGQFRPDESRTAPSDMCVDCLRARDCLDLDTCPRCAHPHAVVFVPRDETLRCSQCEWVGPALLTQSIGFVPPRLRLVERNYQIPF